MITIARLEAYISSHVAAAEEPIKAEFAKFMAFVSGEEAKIKAEVEHLVGLGYKVDAPAPAEPAAPEPAAAAPAAPAA